MIAFVFAFAGALLVLAGLLLSVPDASAVRRVTVPILIVFVSLGTFITAEPAGVDKTGIIAVALGADGEPAASSVTFQENDGGRVVRRVALERPLPMAAPMLWATAALALGVLLVAGTRFGGGVVSRFGGMTTAVLAGLSGLVLAGGVGGLSGTGESEVRAVLGTLRLDTLGVPTSFTVPDGTWRYRAGGPLGLYLAAVLGLVISLVPTRTRAFGPALIALGAAVASIGPGVDIVVTGGLSWRAESGLLWANGLVAAGVVFEREAPIRAAALAGIAVALSILLFMSI